MKIIIIFIYCLLTLTTLHVTAKEQLDAYELGKESFNQGDYEQSLIYLNKALSLGLVSPGLLYSLGSVHYKLKDYLTSRKYFLELIENDEFSALAHYNLGLISHKEKDDELAIKHFKQSEAITRSKKLKKLSSKQIATITHDNKKMWEIYALAGYGYDSNITSAPAGIATSESGSFVRAAILADFILTGEKYNGVVVKANIFATDYLDTSFNDDKSSAVDLSLRDQLDRWRLSYDAGIKQSTYGADDFQRTYRFTFRAKKKLADRNELWFKYRYEDINSLNAQYDYLDGSRQKLGAEYRIKWPADKLRLQYELEVNDRQNTNNPQQAATSNFSPTRNKFTVKYDKKIDSKNSVGGEIEYRISNYDATAIQDRSDDRFGAAIDYVYSFNMNWRVKTKVRYKENDSNEPGDIFDYDRTITTIDLSWFF